MINQTIRNGVGALILATGAVFVAASPAAAAPAAQAVTAPVAAAKPATAAPAAAGDAVFPPAVSSKYVAETPARARMHTCRDQYNVNKTNRSNGGLRWIQTGGGYYSQCNARLKG